MSTCILYTFILRSHYMINIDTKTLFFLLNKTLVQTTPNENKKKLHFRRILAWKHIYSYIRIQNVDVYFMNDNFTK